MHTIQHSYIGDHENTHLVKFLILVWKPRKYDHHDHFGLIEFINNYDIIKNQKYKEELTFELEGEINSVSDFWADYDLQSYRMPHTVCLSFELFFLYVKDMYWYSGMNLTDPMVSMVVHGGLTGVNSHDLTNSVF